MTPTTLDLGDATIPEADFVAAILGAAKAERPRAERVQLDEMRRHLASDHGSQSIGGPAVTAPDPLAAIPAQHRDKYRELAFKVSQGDVKAEAELSKLEAQIADTGRQQLRQQAAESEEHRRAEEAAEKRAQAERKAAERHHAQLVQQRENAFAAIETATASLADAVKSALAIDQATWNAAISLGNPPERRTANRITDYIAWRLGRIGAGLTDMPAVPTVSRGPLVSQPSKEL